MSKNLIFAQKMTKLWACQISQNKKKHLVKYICLQLFPVFYLIQLSSKQIICFDFGKQNRVLPIVLYVLCQ